SGRAARGARGRERRQGPVLGGRRRRGARLGREPHPGRPAPPLERRTLVASRGVGGRGLGRAPRRARGRRRRRAVGLTAPRSGSIRPALARYRAGVSHTPTSRPVVVLVGPPGAGKTTVGERLA